MFRAAILSILVAAIIGASRAETLVLGNIDISNIPDIRITSLPIKTRLSIANAGTTPSLSVSIAADNIPTPAPTLSSIVKRNGTDFIMADLRGNTGAATPTTPTSPSNSLRSSFTILAVVLAGVLGVFGSLQRSSFAIVACIGIIAVAFVSTPAQAQRGVPEQAAQRGVPELQLTLNVPANYTLNSLTVLIAEGSFSSGPFIGAGAGITIRSASINVCGKSTNSVAMSGGTTVESQLVICSGGSVNFLGFVQSPSLVNNITNEAGDVQLMFGQPFSGTYNFVSRSGASITATGGASCTVGSGSGSSGGPSTRSGECQSDQFPNSMLNVDAAGAISASLG